jgi:hypothetical protein
MTLYLIRTRGAFPRRCWCWAEGPDDVMAVARSISCAEAVEIEAAG